MDIILSPCNKFNLSVLSPPCKHCAVITIYLVVCYAPPEQWLPSSLCQLNMTTDTSLPACWNWERTSNGKVKNSSQVQEFKLNFSQKMPHYSLTFYHHNNIFVWICLYFIVLTSIISPQPTCKQECQFLSQSCVHIHPRPHSFTYLKKKCE